MSLQKKRSTAIENACDRAVIRIGVVGHRVIPDRAIVSCGIRKVLNRLYGWLDSTLQNSSYTLVVISPLAEGADRIVAEEVLSRPAGASGCKPYLEAVFPLPEDDYLADFETEESRAEFARLKTRARSAVSLTADRAKTGAERNAAYENVGRYVVANCDILLVIWDGLPSKGRGGTAEIVRYADDIGRSYFWINTLTGEVLEKWNPKRLAESLRSATGAQSGPV